MTLIAGAIVANHTSNINTGMLILLSLGKTHSRLRGKVEAEEKKGKRKKEKKRGNQTSVLLREIKKTSTIPSWLTCTTTATNLSCWENFLYFSLWDLRYL